MPGTHSFLNVHTDSSPLPSAPVDPLPLSSLLDPHAATTTASTTSSRVVAALDHLIPPPIHRNWCAQATTTETRNPLNEMLSPHRRSRWAAAPELPRPRASHSSGT